MAQLSNVYWDVSYHHHNQHLLPLLCGGQCFWLVAYMQPGLAPIRADNPFSVKSYLMLSTFASAFLSSSSLPYPSPPLFYLHTRPLFSLHFHITLIYFLGYVSHFRCSSNSYTCFCPTLWVQTCISTSTFPPHPTYLCFLHCPYIGTIHHRWSYYLCFPLTLRLILRLLVNLLYIVLPPSINYIADASARKPNHLQKTVRKHIPYEDLLATVKWQKLKRYGHVTRSDGLSIVILQRTIEGKRGRGRQKNTWTDMAEWTGKSFAKTQAMSTHNRQEWREPCRHTTDRSGGSHVDTQPTGVEGAMSTHNRQEWREPCRHTTDRSGGSHVDTQPTGVEGAMSTHNRQEWREPCRHTTDRSGGSHVDTQPTGVEGAMGPRQDTWGIAG